MTALILFDFDGTLADTASDLAAAANRQRTRAGLEPLPLEVLRPYSSAGARGLLRCALNLTPADEAYEAHRVQFLNKRVCIGDHIFLRWFLHYWNKSISH